MRHDALPVLTSLLLTDIFAGLSVLTLFLLVVHGDRFSKPENLLLFLFTSFAASTHSATLGVLFGLCCAGWILRPWLGMAVRRLIHGSLTIVSGALMLLACNFALSGEVAWTPGGSGVAFGRMLQDGLVKRYLDDHCATEKLKLCPYRNSLPQTADGFLWGTSVFNQLGRFKGMGDEMAHIAWHSLLAYPAAQSEAALKAAATQLVSVATGEGSNNWLGHTYGIIERYLPQELAAVRKAHQQRWEFDFTAINRIHVPVALLSMALLASMMISAAGAASSTMSRCWRGQYRWHCSAMPCCAACSRARTTAMARGWCGLRPLLSSLPAFAGTEVAPQPNMAATRGEPDGHSCGVKPAPRLSRRPR